MDPNTHSTQPPVGPPDWDHDGQVVDLHALAAEDLDQLADPALSLQVAQLQRQWNTLGGQWLRRLAALDARGAAGAELDQPALSTASWLRHRLHMSAAVAHSTVRTARALFRGPLPQTAQALLDGDISPAHAQAVVEGTHHLPDHVVSAAEPVLLEAARRLDPPQLRRLVGHLVQVADPDGADRARDRRHDQRGLWLSPTFDGLVAVKGLLEPEAGNIVRAALEPLARPQDAHDDRKGSQRTADALTELARRVLEGGRLPKAGGVRPQLLVTIDLDSLLGRPGAVGGDTGWVGPLDPETCRRLACDAAVSRVVVTRQPPTSSPRATPPTKARPPPTATRPATASPPTTTLMGRSGSKRSSVPPWLCCPRSSAVPPPSRWRWAGPPGWSIRLSGRRWPCGTVVVSFRVVSGRWHGVMPIICGTGSTAARLIWPISPSSAGLITGPCMRAAGS
jgi:hypothetical protein